MSSAPPGAAPPERLECAAYGNPADHHQNKVAAGLYLVGAGAITLIISLFLTWYGLALPSNFGQELNAGTEQLPPELRDFGQVFGKVIVDSFANVGGTAWEMFELADVVLFGCAIVALCTVLAAMGFGEWRNVRATELARLSAVAGTIAVGTVLVKMFDQPEPAQLFELEVGPFVALAGAAAMALGGSAASRS
jgi:hypothetical protein